MTFKELQDDTLERLTFDAGTSASSARTRVKRFINEIYRRVLRDTGLSRLLTGETTITTVANQADYTVTGAQIKKIYDATGNRTLTEVTLSELRDFDPDGDVGTPDFYIVKKVGASTLTVTLYPTPSANDQILNVDLGSNTTPLAQDADVPVLPEDYHYILGTGARMLEAKKMEKWDAYSAERDEFKDGLGKLRLHLAKSKRPGFKPNRKGAFNATYTGQWVEWGL